jgi:hypothetical protein
MAITYRAEKGSALTNAEVDANFAQLANGSIEGFLQSGGTARSWISKAREIVSVKDFGAVGDGVTDDTDAISAAISYCKTLAYKSLYFPFGNYKTTDSLTKITGNNWHIYGDGEAATRVFGTHNGPIFTIDVSAATSFFGIIEKMAIEGGISGTYSSSVSILVEASAASATGLQYWKFDHLKFRDIYRGMYFESTAAQTVGSFTGLSYHQFLSFGEITVPVAAANAVFNTIAFEGSGPVISSFSGGHIRGSGAAIKLGNGEAGTAAGDLLFNGIHIVTADVGIDIFGPSDPTDYNQNVNIIGCQIDNCSTATVRMDKMQNCRIGPNSSTANVGVTLTNCTNIFSEDRNTFYFPKPIYPGDPSGTQQNAAGLSAGSGAPSDSDGSNGDFYFRSDGTVLGNTAIYHKEAGAWVALTTT